MSVSTAVLKEDRNGKLWAAMVSALMHRLGKVGACPALVQDERNTAGFANVECAGTQIQTEPLLLLERGGVLLAGYTPPPRIEFRRTDGLENGYQRSLACAAPAAAVS